MANIPNVTRLSAWISEAEYPQGWLDSHVAAYTATREIMYSLRDSPLGWQVNSSDRGHLESWEAVLSTAASLELFMIQ